MTKTPINWKSLVTSSIWLPVLFLYIVGVITVCGFMGWAAGHQPHNKTTVSFPPACTAAAVIKASEHDFPVQGTTFCLSMMIPLIWPTTLFAAFVKGLPLIHHRPRGETTYFGSVPQSYKDTSVIALSVPHTQTQFINRCRQEYLLSAEGCYFMSVWGESEGTKVAGEGAFSLKEDFPTQRGRPWYSCMCRNIYNKTIYDLNAPELSMAIENL